jgi:hypothetical protein
MLEPSPQYWAVARVQSQREVFAAQRLTVAGFEIFLPRVETKRSIEPLFKGYVFLLIVGGIGLQRTPALELSRSSGPAIARLACPTPRSRPCVHAQTLAA